MVGLGGIWVEALGDVRLMAPDLTEDEIAEEIGRLKTAKLLHGFRGAPPADIKGPTDLTIVPDATIRDLRELPAVVHQLDRQFNGHADNA